MLMAAWARRNTNNQNQEGSAAMKIFPPRSWTVPAEAHRALNLLALVLPGWAQAGALSIVSANYQHGAQ